MKRGRIGGMEPRIRMAHISELRGGRQWGRAIKVRKG